MQSISYSKAQELFHITVASQPACACIRTSAGVVCEWSMDKNFEGLPS